MEDLAANIEILNQSQKGWTNSSWWEGQTWENFQACGRCTGEEDYIGGEDLPELCKCTEAPVLDGRTRVTWILTLEEEKERDHLSRNKGLEEKGE